MMLTEKIFNILKERNIDYKYIEHAPTVTCEESAAARGEDIGIGGKTLLFKDKRDFRIFVISARLQAVQKNKPIVVLHGTDTMSKTAKYCYENISSVSVPVIFTGAMRPKGFVDTDANQNVAEALFALSLVEPGFYISFHNRLYNVPDVQKNYQKRTFEKI